MPTEKQLAARNRMKALIRRDVEAHQAGTAGGQKSANSAVRINGRKKAHDKHEAHQHRRVTGRLK